MRNPHASADAHEHTSAETTSHSNAPHIDCVVVHLTQKVPVVTGVSGCTDDATSATTTDCSTSGFNAINAAVVITVTGEEFKGSSSVTVGGRQCREPRLLVICVHAFVCAACVSVRVCE